MKLLFLTLACIIALATANCPTDLTLNLYEAKCKHDLVFRGTLTSGSSSMFQDGPYNYFHRWDYFSVKQVYKGKLISSDMTAQIAYTMSIQDDSHCGYFPYGPGGSEYLVLAKRSDDPNLQVPVYYVEPCSTNPAWNCVNTAAFEAIQCNDDPDTEKETTA